MEELFRFVAVRAPEYLEPSDEARAVSINTESDFQARLDEADPESRFDIAQEYTESDEFVEDPSQEDVGAALLKARKGVDLTTISTRDFVRRIIESLRELSVTDSSDESVARSEPSSEGGNEKNLKKIVQQIVDHPIWKETRVKLADTLIALSLNQNSKVRSTIRHESVLALMHFLEQVAVKKLSEVSPAEIANYVLATTLSLTPVAPQPQHEGEEPDAGEDPGSNRVRHLKNVNKATEFLLSLPRAKLTQVEDEPPEVIFAENTAANDVEAAAEDETIARFATGRNGVSYVVNPAAFEDLDSKVRGVITNLTEKLGTNDVSQLTMALRHDEQEIYAQALPVAGTRIKGTTLTVANVTIAAGESIRGALDVVLNPAIPFNPELLGPELFGAITQPRFGLLGLGELLVVRQNLKAYSALDVAHIENVLQGESKVREHRRRRLTEEIFFTESETQIEEERDTQTSERYELSSEVEEEVKETFKFDAGVKVTAKLGPFVEMEADARFGYENAKTEGRKKATQFSRETTERAVSRYSERVLERRQRRLVEEIEELNRHGIDATTAASNIMGVYQWVNKVYEAQVYNYGLREMYEIFLPEPATFYIGSLVSKGLTDGDKPTPPPPFTISPSTLNRSNYKYYTSRYKASGVPAPPEEFAKVDLAQAGGPLDFDSSENGNVAAGFSITIPDGYEYFGYRYSYDYTYRGDNSWFDLSVSDAVGDPGSVPVYVQGNRIVSWAFWVHVTCRATTSFMDDWRLKSWEAMRDGYLQMQREYEEKIAASAVEEGIEITGRNPLANERIILDEIQRQCMSALTNQTPAGNNGVSGAPGSVVVDWEKAYKKGLYARFMHQAFEWENVSYIFYPFFWSRKSRWLELFNIEDIDPDFQTFLQSGMARVVLPVRPGFEQHVEHLRRTGEVWSGGQPPSVGDPDYLSMAAEIKADTGAPGDEEPVGEPWEIVVPTQLVGLRADNQLPKWRKNEDGQWVEDNE